MLSINADGKEKRAVAPVPKHQAMKTNRGHGNRIDCVGHFYDRETSTKEK
jgi:hypothetical protein